ncbi:MAG: hypothetical protein AB1817_11765 [Chloroflexota bacterium]
MYLVHPDYLIGDAPLPSFAIRAYAQVLCEDFAQRIGVQAPPIIVINGQSNHVTFDDVPLCQSPIKHWARWTRDGDLALASFAFNPLQLQFAIGHTLAHLIEDALEWECDLAALEWMNVFDVPLVESTTRIIAQVATWRKRVPHSEFGRRVLAIGDALRGGIWQVPLFQV